MVVASTWGAGQVAYSLLWFFLFVIEIWLMFSVFIDLFRSHDLKGWQKALWVLFVLVLPIVGILAYFIVRGDKMRAHNAQWMQHYPGGGGPGGWGGRYPGSGAPRSAHDVVDSLHKLTELRDRAEITSEQYRRLRDELLGEDGGTPPAES